MTLKQKLKVIAYNLYYLGLHFFLFFVKLPVFISDIPQGYPRITENPQLQNIHKGQKAEMSCSAEAEGMDKPNIYWLKEDQPVDLTDERIKVNENGNFPMFGYFCILFKR